MTFYSAAKAEKKITAKTSNGKHKTKYSSQRQKMRQAKGKQKAMPNKTA